MIIQRFEKGQKFLDLVRDKITGIVDGCVFDYIGWSVSIYENDISDFNKHRNIDFDSEVMARMFISNNQWQEQASW